MPFYTYVTLYRGVTYITQRRRSNVQGFADWMEGLPAEVRKSIKSPYAGFEPVRNRQNVWQGSFAASGGQLLVTAIRTED
jgi:hypothetical protein